MAFSKFCHLPRSQLSLYQNDAIGRQGLLTPPWNLIIPLLFKGSVLLCFKFVFRSIDFWNDWQFVIDIFHYSSLSQKLPYFIFVILTIDGKMHQGSKEISILSLIFKCGNVQFTDTYQACYSQLGDIVVLVGVYNINSNKRKIDWWTCISEC